MNKTVASRTLLGYAAILLVFLISNSVIFWFQSQVASETEDLKAIGDQTLVAKDLVKLMIDMETGLRGFLPTGDRLFLEPFTRGEREFDDRLDDVKGLTGVTADDRAAFERLGARKAEWLAAYANPQIEAVTATRQAITSEAIGRGKHSMDAIREDGDRLIGRLLSRREEIASSAKRRAAITQWIVAFGTLAALVAAAVVGGYAVRDVTRRLRAVIYGTSAAAAQIASTVVEQERTVVQVAGAVNEVSATASELNATSQRSAEGADAIARESQTALEVSRAGAQSVLGTVSEMRRIREKVEAVATQVLGLSEQTAKIGSLAALMGDFANQTNLLALNAAVEAARAGEHGRGLGVVAGEIRRLADQSKQATERTRELVAEIQRATNATVMATEEGAKRVDAAVGLAERSGEAIGSLEATFERTVSGVRQIAATAREQARATEQVTLAMGDVDRTMQEIVAATAQTGRAADSLEKLTGALRELVD
jgi:methyl-accepting chemotaxis protein